MKDFTELSVWWDATEIRKKVLELTADFPVSERLQLAGLMRKEAEAIPSNISEGFKRRQKNEFMPFLKMALSSVSTLESHTQNAHALGYIEGGAFNAAILDLETLKKALLLMIAKSDGRTFERGPKPRLIDSQSVSVQETVAA